MKKCLIVAALALFSVAGMQAQIVSSRSVNIKTTEVKKPKTTTWMVRGGMNVGKFVGDGADDTDSKIGYDVAFSFQKPIKDAGLFWGMEFALGTRGYSIKEDGGYGEGEDFKQMSHAFRWSPFTLGYRYDINDKFAVDAHLGAFVSVDYAGKIKWGDDDLSIGDWDQERAYTVTIDSETMRVSDIVPVKENSYGYVAELSLFIGKTRHEIAIMSGGDLSTDADTSATVTNTALRGMLIECFDYVKNEMEGGNNG